MPQHSSASMKNRLAARPFIMAEALSAAVLNISAVKKMQGWLDKGDNLTNGKQRSSPDNSLQCVEGVGGRRSLQIAVRAKT